jgi:hypothetical protein
VDKLLEFCVASSAPWFALLPNFVSPKSLSLSRSLDRSLLSLALALSLSLACWLSLALSDSRSLACLLARLLALSLSRARALSLYAAVYRTPSAQLPSSVDKQAATFHKKKSSYKHRHIYAQAHKKKEAGIYQGLL